MSNSQTDIIRQRIRALCERRVFQGYEEMTGKFGKTYFRFRWLLGREVCIESNDKKQQVLIKDLLPCIENRSFIDNDLRTFIANQASENIVSHRRANPAIARLKYRNSKQSVSLVMDNYSEQTTNAFDSLLRVVNDLFTYLHLYHVDYLYQHFDVPEE